MRRFKAAVIGSGFIGSAHVEALKRVPGVDVVALVDIRDAQRKAEEADVPCGFSDYQEMIDKVKPDCIHICTPNHTHKDIAIYALEHGINVVCEKPLASNAEEALEMLEAARRSKLINAVNLHNRFYPANHQLRNVIRKNGLGRIYGVYGGYLQDCFSKETDFNWRMMSKYGGKTRVTADIGSHWIDLAEYVIGSRVKEVFAEFQTSLPIRQSGLDDKEKPVKVDTEDTACVTIRFDNGAVGNAIFSQVYQGRKNQTFLKVSGSKASAEWDSESISDLRIGYRDEPDRIWTKDPALADPCTAPIISYPGGHVEGFPDAFKQNFNAIYGDMRGIKPANPYATFEDGAHLMRVIDSVFESAEKGRWVSV